MLPVVRRSPREDPNSQTMRDMFDSQGVSRAIAFCVVGLLCRSALAHHPHDPIDAFAINPAYPTDQAIFVASAGSVNLFLQSEDSGRIWRERRSGLKSRQFRAVSVASDWSESGTAYAAGDGGLQWTTNRGRAWNSPPLRGDLLHLAVPPVSPTGQSLFYATDRILYGSFDGGRTDAVLGKIPPSSPVRIASMAVSPSFDVDSTVVVALSDSSVALSGDGGSNFRRVQVGAPVRHVAISPDHATDGTLWLSTWGSGVLRSTDGGNSFGPVNGGLAELDVNHVAPAPTYPAPPDLWASTRSQGVFRSADGGDSWQRTGLDVVLTDQTEDHFRFVNVSPGWPENPVLYAGTFEGLFGSFDGGSTWSQANINPTRMGRVLAASPDFSTDGVVFGAGYGQHVLVTEDRGDTWRTEFDDFGAISAYCLAVSPDFEQDGMLLAGAGTGIRRSTDMGATWEIHELAPFDSTFAYNSIRSVVFSPDFARDGHVFACANGGFYTSTDRGQTWSVRVAPFDHMWRLAISPDFARDSTFYAAGPVEDNGIYRSVDGGRTWSEITPPASVLDLDVAPDYATSRTLYCIAGGRGLLKSTDAGQTWDIFETGLAGAVPTTLVRPPGGGGAAAWVVSTAGGGLFESMDGAPWRRITAFRSPADHAVSLALASDYPDDPTLFAGTFDGIIRSTDGGDTWELGTTREIYDDRRKEPWVGNGPWTRIDAAGCINQGYAESDVAGRELGLDFVGVGFTVFGTMGPDHGRFSVFVDGSEIQVVDAFAPVEATKVALVEVGGLSDGFHQLMVRVLGESDPASTGQKVGIDAVEITYRQP